ncbi:head morphogenesis domain-containing protein [Serratia phage MTx]|uniref:Head morphogenesis domain-containing protein n=1 Tax=Serratia phage MTx TaxID=2557553 RepID=A0A482MI48_9CAUD|nr:head morphogenesis [Serratia phage MTx]QBQ72334.1 head morphogenesis domain-containing protein [Serratia phage MTx]
MPFKASKKRERKPDAPIGVGAAIVPSASIESWYRQQMESIFDAMISEYKSEIEKAFKNKDVKEFYAEDASVNSIFNKLFKRLQSKWTNVFKGFAKETSKKFVNKTEVQATAATLYSLKVAGLKSPVAAYNKNVYNTIEASKDFNYTLITGLSDEAHEKMHEAVMLSLTSPDPAQQGQESIVKALSEVGIKTKERVKLIARDQTSKLYCSLSDQRMEENGVEEFEWMHSSAGKVPRQTHLDRNGQIYKLNDPRLWEGPKADQGPPGWAINCRCRRRPIIR